MISFRFKRPNPGDPIYLLARHGRLVDCGNSYPKVFYSVEHFECTKKMHPKRYLDTDKLIKYVPAPEEEWLKQEEN